MTDPFDDLFARHPWEATVEPCETWLLGRWYITVGAGLMGMSGCKWAWTRAGAERKARRWVTKLQRQDDRRERETFKVPSRATEPYRTVDQPVDKP